MNKSYHIVYESAELVLVHKYPDINFHTENGVLGLFETVRQTQGYSTLYPVHRLDKVTSGLILMAKTSAANRDLCDQFEARSVQKYYFALSQNKPQKKQGAIVGDMTSARRGAWKLERSRVNPAITQFFSCGVNSGHRFFMIKPLTGRTHQIRVALKSIGAPIIGDGLYSAFEAKAADRAYLHAFSIGFSINGEFKRFSEPPKSGRHFLTDSCQAVIHQYHSPWELPWPAL